MHPAVVVTAVAAQGEEEERLRAERTDGSDNEDEAGSTSASEQTKADAPGLATNMGKLPMVVNDLSGEANTMDISKPSRKSVRKGSNKSTESSFAPMRYGIANATTTTKKFQFKTDQLEQTEYMVNYDSDEERKSAGGKGGIDGEGSAGDASAVAAAAAVKRKAVLKRNAVPRRDRPISAHMFRDVANADPELKVHYRQSNFRRMPMTDEQDKWLDLQEKAREKAAAERLEALKEAMAGSKDKGKDKKDGKDKGGKGDKGDKGGKGKGKGKEPPLEPVKIPCKYKSAGDFMKQHFPNFDAEGPLRTWQLLEVKQIMEQLEEGAVTEQTLVKALVIPQDRPESICLEGLKRPGEGLMVNPLPEEFWRKGLEGGKGKKGKKGKGKKKK
mgnify:CR=1 FL=1